MEILSMTNKIIVISLLVLSVVYHIIWLWSKNSYYYKQAIWLMLLAMLNILVN